MFPSHRWLLALLLGLTLHLHAAEQTHTYPNGDTYTGEMKDGARHGRGRMKYANGREYFGEWIDDRRQGYGLQTWKNSPKYISYKGNWENDLPEGTGEIAFQSGQVYTGHFKKALLQGQGQLAYANGDVRHGSFVQNKREGEFILFTADGRQYKETFVKDKRTSITRLQNVSKQKTIRRGSLEVSKDASGIPIGFKIRDFGDSTDLPRLGVEVGDVLQELCGVRLTSPYDWQQADSILMAKEKPCTVKILRKGQTLTLNDIT